MQAVANLNILYNKYNIYFKYRGYEEINSPELPDDPNGYYILENIYDYYGLVDWAKDNDYFKEDAMNVYAFGWSENAGGIGPFKQNHCGVSSSNLTTFLMLHEIGHNLDLRHTRSSSGISGERVTRDPNNPNYNANTHGDKVIDTAANPGYRDGDQYPFVNLETCEYENDGNQRDYVGELYVPTRDDVRNVMSNAYPCMDLSSPLSFGQGIRARETLISDTNGKFAPVKTTIESLYEPYKGEYFVESGTNDELYLPLFQPGFDYKFLECCCDYPEPAEYNDISFSYSTNSLLTISKYETDFHLITHPNHSAIQIKFSPILGNQFSPPRKCYDNWNVRPRSGTIIHFLDGIFNTNVTIKSKDSTGINNPTLIEDLEPGLYKIKKKYKDGYTQEKNIYKE